MKNVINSLLLIGAFSISIAANSQEEDSLGMVGDGLDLHAVLDAFKQAESIESFEATINDKNSKINNLDLDEDDQVDYIQVIDNMDADAHAIVLRIDVSETESQDVAVIEVEKTGDDVATVQVVGDEDLYGEDYIVEALEMSSEGQSPPAIIIVNAWGWPSVRFIYGPAYKPWRSPWRYRKYPATWKPWKPFRYNAYHGFHKHHRAHYHVVHVHRVGRAHKVYHKNRKSWKHIHNHSHHHHGHHKSGTHKSQKNGSKGNKGHKNGSKVNNGGNQNKSNGNKAGSKGNKRGNSRR